MIKTIFKIIGAILIGLATYLGGKLASPEYDILKNILAVFTSTLFLFFESIYDFFKTWKNKKNRSKLIANHLIAFKKFLSKNLDYKLEIKEIQTELGKLDIDFNKRENVFINTIQYIAGFTNVELDGILLTAICYEIDTDRDILNVDRYKNLVANLFERYNFFDLDDDAKKLVTFYVNYKNNKKLTSSVNNLDYKIETNNFTKKYNKTYNLTFQLKLEKDQAEEFRTTLAVLISTGKLNIKQIEKNLQQRINAELESRAKKSKAFLVLANRFHKFKEIEKVLNKFPNVYFPFKRPTDLPESIKYLHTRIIYPPDNYQNASDFLIHEIKPHIPADRINDGFIAIIPLEGTELYSYPEKADDIKYSYMKEGFESITAYKTGVSINMSELYIESMQDEINIDEILSTIPFNIFVPKISPYIRNFIIENYDDIKKKFGIKRLADWSSINERDLKNFLIQLDIARGKKRLYKDENWEKLSYQIIEQSKKHQKAISNI